MRKLLSANFSRLWRDKVFWITLLGVFLFSLITILNGARSAKVMAESGYARTLEDYYFVHAPYMSMIYAAFISLFLGTEYSDGTMRNKLVIGHTRVHVYLANFLVCFAACLCFVAAWFIGCAPGLVLIGPFEMGVVGFIAYGLVAIGFTAAFSALFTWISMMSANKALTVIFALAAWIGLVLIASAFQDRLLESEMNGGVAYINGAFVTLDPAPNPLYLSGTVREVCEWILDFLPSGQTLLMHGAAIEHPMRQLLLSLLFTVAVIIPGIASFCRKDLK